MQCRGSPDAGSSHSGFASPGPQGRPLPQLTSHCLYPAVSGTTFGDTDLLCRRGWVSETCPAAADRSIHASTSPATPNTVRPIIDVLDEAGAR